MRGCCQSGHSDRTAARRVVCQLASRYQRWRSMRDPRWGRFCTRHGGFPGFPRRSPNAGVGMPLHERSWVLPVGPFLRSCQWWLTGVLLGGTAMPAVTGQRDVTVDLL